MTDRAAPALRLVALMLAVSVAGGPLVLGSHLTSHVHRWCEAHATLEDVPVGAQSMVSHDPPTALDTERAVTEATSGLAFHALGADTASSADEHDTCLLAALSLRAPAPSASVLSFVVASQSVPAIRPDAREESPLAVLRVAPKASPPARG